MNDYVNYNAKYKVFICRAHKYGITPDYIPRHFRDHHKGTPLPTRQAIVDYSKTLDLAAPDDIAIPTEAVEPIKELCIVDGFRCEYDGCSELRGTYGSMKEHCKRVHEWVTATGVMWVSETCQKLFDGPHHK
jgi:Orsellinic acid/F9775 biosynthesis cluster protein D